MEDVNVILVIMTTEWPLVLLVIIHVLVALDLDIKVVCNVRVMLRDYTIYKQPVVIASIDIMIMGSLYVLYVIELV